MQKNVAGQTFYIFAYDTVNNVPKTGDAANITVRRSLDGGALAAISGNPTELDATNAKGVYVVSPAQGDTNGNSIAFPATSTTSGIQIDPIFYQTEAPNNNKLGIDSSGNLTGSVASVVGAVGSVTGAVGSVTGSVGSVVGGVTVTTNNDKIGYRLAYEVRTGTAQAGASGSITLDSGASSTDHFYEGCWVEINSGTGANQGARLITAYVGATKVASVAPNWTTAPDNTSVFTILPAGQISGVQGNVTGSVGSVSGSVASVTGAVGSVTGAVGSVTGNVGGSVVGDVQGKVLGGGSSVLSGSGVIAASVTGAVGSVTGAVGSVTGSVGGDVAGKVLGGGSSTITGDGVRAASVTGAVGSVTGAVGSVTGSVGSVTAGVILASSGLDSVLIESGIVAGANLTNDSGTQLTSINARQALSLTISALAGVISGAGTSDIVLKPAGLPSGNTRIESTAADASGNRPTLNLKVPT